ncbi:MAG: cobalt-precorrin-5B (C(1))-methyltransferase, partial [Aestuariivirgaceae bacterium]
MVNSIPKPQGQLRRGWTTGACATAATKAAFTALVTGKPPASVEITLPRGERVTFQLALCELAENSARAG